MSLDTKGAPSPESFLPLGQTVFYILAALFDGPKHGYLIAKHVEKVSGGSVRIAIGNLYVSLKRLRDDGLIELDTRVTADDHRITKTYRLTGLGERVLERELVRLDRLRNAVPAFALVTRGAPG